MSSSTVYYLPELASFILLSLAQLHIASWLLARQRTRLRPVIWLLTGAGIGLLLIGLLFGVSYLQPLAPKGSWWHWLRGAGIVWGMILAGIYLAALLCRKMRVLDPDFRPERRRFIQMARVALFAAPVTVAGYGVFIERNRVRLQEINVPVPGLPRDLDGIRLVQLSDIHFSAFLRAPELEAIVSMANETKAHLALVTGDLISFRSDDLHTCLALLARLKADAGIVGCLGNHEISAGVERDATSQGARLGIDFLRSSKRTLQFGSAALNVAGVDYQKFRRPYLVGAEKLLSQQPDTCNLLLSHNPDVFPVAAKQGYDLTLAGHTHGGQVNVEILSESINPARFFTPYVYGFYRDSNRAMYVTRGIGTVGVPARIGAPPEIALLRLCATSS
jgi:predicted MPP superfamily phosphohydrolase